jgi:hypothetical protein
LHASRRAPHPNPLPPRHQLVDDTQLKKVSLAASDMKAIAEINPKTPTHPKTFCQPKTPKFHLTK